MKTLKFIRFSVLLSLFMVALFIISSGSSSGSYKAPNPSFSSTGDTILKAKHEYLELKGNVRHQKGVIKDETLPIDSALITIYNGDIPFSELWTNKKGKCSFKLPLEKNFRIEVSKRGFVRKSFEVNTKVPPDKKNTFIFGFDIDIFEEVKGLDVSVLNKAIAKVAYNIILEQFAYDVAYTSRINHDLKKMYKNYYLLQKIEADSLGKSSAIIPEGTKN